MCVCVCARVCEQGPDSTSAAGAYELASQYLESCGLLTAAIAYMARAAYIYNLVAGPFHRTTLTANVRMGVLAQVCCRDPSCESVYVCRVLTHSHTHVTTSLCARRRSPLCSTSHFASVTVHRVIGVSASLATARGSCH